MFFIVFVTFLSKVMLVGILLLRVRLAPGSIENLEIDTKYGENETIELEMSNLEANSKYEMRVSWPSIWPIHNYFLVDCAVDISDEKVVFIPEMDHVEGTLVIQGRGVSKTEQRYEVPVNISLEKQYFGLTRHVWILIAYALPVLASSIFVALKVFPDM